MMFRSAGRVFALCVVSLLAAGPAAGDTPGRHWNTQDCLLEPSMVVDLSSPVIGVITRIEVDRGDPVADGATVVRLNAKVEEADVRLKQARAEFSRVTVKRNEELFEQKLLSPQERDQIGLDSEIARLELNAAVARLRQKDIVSPISGIVLERLMDPGEYVGEEPILRIARLDPLNVEAVLSKELFGTVRNGDQATVTLEEPLGSALNATVVVVDPVIDAASGTFRVRLHLPNPHNSVPAGLKCTVAFD